MIVLKSPYRREELIQHLEALSDIEYQRRSWVENRTDAFSFAIHFFLDDTALVDDPKAHIGYFLVDETEARAVQKVALAIDYILEEEGTMSRRIHRIRRLAKGGFRCGRSPAIGASDPVRPRFNT